MKSQYGLSLIVGGIVCVAQPWPFGGPGGWSANLPSCAQSCTTQWDKDSCSANKWGSCTCSEPGLIASVNSCIASSSCTDGDKNNAYQKIVALCALAGTTLTNPPEASLTGYLLVESLTSPWGPNATPGSGNNLSPYNNGPWSKGPFYHGGYTGSWTTGPWTSGAWTSWWNGKACPDPSWPGWTSGSWSSDPQWTSWTACSAETTSSTAVVVTNTRGLVQTTTSYGVKVAEQTAVATSVSTGSSGDNDTITTSNQGKQIGSGFLFGALTATLLGIFVLL